jgi:hypothetical protein
LALTSDRAGSGPPIKRPAQTFEQRRGRLRAQGIFWREIHIHFSH